jgi:hypothetical protein
MCALTRIIAITAIAFGSVAHAQTPYIINLVKDRPVALHADPDLSQRVRTAEATELRDALPVQVLKEDGDILQVRLGDRSYWVQGDIFLVSRDLKIVCADAESKAFSRQREAAGMGRGAGSMRNPCADAK